MSRKSWGPVVTLALLVSTLLLAGCGGGQKAAVAAGPDWPQWRGARRDGVSTETSWNPMSLQGSPKILWKKDVGTGYSSASIQAGRLYIMGAKEARFTIFCLDAVSGREIWKTRTKSTRDSEATPAVDGDRLYCLVQDGTLLCLKTSSGAEVWKVSYDDDLKARRPNSGWAASPVIEGGLVLVNASSVLAALDKMTGKIAWKIEDPVPPGSWGSYATPVVATIEGARRALFLGASNLVAVDLPGGTPAWSYPHGDGIHTVADPVVSGDGVFISVPQMGAVLTASGSKVQEVWKSLDHSTWLPPAVLVDGHLYGCFIPSSLFLLGWGAIAAQSLPFRCVDWQTGKTVWEKPMTYVSVMAAGDRLITMELNGTIRVIEASPAGYKEIAATSILTKGKGSKTFAVPPVLWNGRLYCRNYDGELTCIDVSN
jgi:outer membrane protein assembly factor BamB